jgi:DNA-binding CsgD family transcriptional regulator/tetratricopeptide (TPR) repeat protein
VSAKVRARALTLAGALAQWQQDYERAVALEHEALDLWWTLPLAEQYLAWGAFSILGDAARARGDYAGAEAWYQQMLEHAQQVGGTRNVAGGLMQLGHLRADLGEYGQAGEMLDQALAIARPAGDSWVISMCLSNLSSIAISLGNLARARELLDESIELLHKMGNRTQLAECAVTLGWLDLYEELTDTAEAHFSEAGTLAHEIGAEGTVAAALVGHGEVAAQRGDLDLAERHYREALALAQLVGDLWTKVEGIEGIAKVCLRRGEVERAVRLLAATSQARDAYNLPRFPIEEAAIERALATARQTLPDTRFAVAWEAGQSMSLDQAIVDVVERLPVSAAVAGSAPSAGVTPQELHSEHTMPRPPDDGPPLTPREKDVLQLLVEGLSDTEIAERLSIGPRTVSGHVTSILNKFGLSSRTAVATYAVRHRLA